VGHAADPSLTEATLLDAVRELCARDPDLAAIVRRYGPPLWARPNTFATLVHTVLEQQVSLAWAQAAFDCLVGATGRLTPGHSWPSTTPNCCGSASAGRRLAMCACWPARSTPVGG
jgi:3-methyladenine DNA glycosylase/8-oxoguanine DNA glycosylase